MSDTGQAAFQRLGYTVERPGWPIGTPRPVAHSTAIDPITAALIPAPTSGATGPSASTEPSEEVMRLRAELHRMEQSLTAARARERQLTQQFADRGDTPLAELDDAVVLQQVGIYEYHHPLENAEAYRTRLDDLRERIKECVKQGAAVESSDRFVFNNSLAQGRRMTSDLSKLMLRAYNAEADNCLRTMRAGTVATAKARLERTVASISKLGALMQLRVSADYHQLRIEEFELTADYLFRLQEEREEAKEERARLREQRREEQQLREERERLNKERRHYENTLAELTRQGRAGEAGEIERRLSEIQDAIENTDYRIANQRAGYVYVISNLGAFGPGVVKIGLTRRLDPAERVHELGGASVPFPFDVHAIYFSDDAVTLENDLHHHFGSRRLNQVNLRREFFRATPAEVRQVLVNRVGSLLEYVDVPAAEQYHQSQHANQ